MHPNDGLGIGGEKKRRQEGHQGLPRGMDHDCKWVQGFFRGRGDKVFWTYITVMTAHLYGYTGNHQIVDFKRSNYMFASHLLIKLL